jgi:hypothetical protein
MGVVAVTVASLLFALAAIAGLSYALLGGLLSAEAYHVVVAAFWISAISGAALIVSGCHLMRRRESVIVAPVAGSARPHVELGDAHERRPTLLKRA